MPRLISLIGFARGIFRDATLLRIALVKPPALAARYTISGIFAVPSKPFSMISHRT
jgi:hypothetical protein